MIAKKFYNIEEMSSILGKSIASIYGHLARRQFDAVPPPMKLGRRLAWLVVGVDAWIEEKMTSVTDKIEKYKNHVEEPEGKRGRPGKLRIIS